MNSIWKSLLWKEWREQRWQLVALTSLVMALFVPFIVYSINQFQHFEFTGWFMQSMRSCGVFYMLLASTFVGMSVSGGESAKGTYRFLQSLPTPSWQKSLTKLAMAIVTVAIPVIATSLLVAAYVLASKSSPRFLDYSDNWISHWFEQDIGIVLWFAIETLSVLLGVASLLLWMAAAGMNRSDEIRAGAIGFLICSSTWLVFVMLLVSVGKYSPALEDALLYLAPALPGGLLILPEWFLKDNQLANWISLAFATVSHSAVFIWFLKQNGSVAIQPKRGVGHESNLFPKWKSKSIPLQSQWQAIALKQLRETGPLVALFVACILVVVPIVYFINKLQTDFGEILGTLTLSAGFFVILVAGIGVFLEDFSPGINNFWRSRPVNLNQWFAVKYIVGLAVLALAFSSLLIPAYWLQTELGNDPLYWFIHSAIFATYFLALLYALSMASYCLLRQPVYAAILTLGIYFCGMMSIDWVNHVSLSTLAVSMILALAIPITIAWLAVKHDWGWKAGR